MIIAGNAHFRPNRRNGIIVNIYAVTKSGKQDSILRTIFTHSGLINEPATTIIAARFFSESHMKVSSVFTSEDASSTRDNATMAGASGLA
jgi:hypothetical protein